MTFLVGENGSGKSTLIEAIAVAAKLNAEGGGQRPEASRPARRTRVCTGASSSSGRSSRRSTRSSSAPRASSTSRRRSRGGYIGAREDVYERPLHEQSHGESFLDIAVNRLGPRGFYIFDEPEAALSVNGQLALMRRMHELVEEHSQFVVATHSPILMGYPDATILQLGDDGIRRVAYEETEQVELTKSFLEDPQRFFRHLLS